MATGILVPLDGSSLAEQALSCAVPLCQVLPAEIVLLRAVWISPKARLASDRADAGVNETVRELVSQADDYLQGMARSLRETHLDVRCAVRHGPPAKTIVDYAAQADVQQIVMATRSYGAPRRWTRGSVAERVVQAAQAPVLLVRCSDRDARDAREPLCCRRILVPLDGLAKAEQVLPPTAELARALGCKVILFQVPATFLFEHSSLAAERMANAYLARVAGRLKEQGIKVSVATGPGLVAESVVQFAQSNDVDLIAMATHGRTGIARWALGSVAGDVIREGSTPVLLVRTTRRPSRHSVRDGAVHCHGFVTTSSRCL